MGRTGSGDGDGHDRRSRLGYSERTFVEERDGEAVMCTTAMAHLGGATLDNEENYLIRKLFAAGLEIVCISNQDRI
jgi:formate dehydrogenase major subunit